MAKNLSSIDTHSPGHRRLTLFNEIAKVKEVEDVDNQLKTGSKNIQSEFKQAIARALSDSGLSRFEIASRMSDLLATGVSKSMLDAYVAESRKAHRMPGEFLAAFCLATGSNAPLEVICKHLNLYLVPSEDALWNF